MSRNWQMEMMIFENSIKRYLTDNSSNPISSETSSLSKVSCYDDYYCNNYELSQIGHILFGVFGLILTLAGLILNILLIPVMSLVGIRSSATYYMIAMAISDSCLLIINLILVVIRYLPSADQLDQLLMYQNFVAFLVPFGFPMKSVCQILTLSFCTGLILDRYLYLRIEKKPKNYIKCTIAIKTVVSITVSMILLKLPNFLLLKIVENSESFSAIISVRWTMLAKPWIFVFDLILFIVVYFSLVCSVAFLSYLSLYNQFVPNFAIKKRFEVAPEQKLRRRERLYFGMGLFVGILTIVFKFPHLLSYAFSFNPVNSGDSLRYRLLIINFWMEGSDLLLIVSKPLLYLIFAIHFRQALKDMIGLCFRPSRYNELKVSGGIGKSINLHENSERSKFSRSDTSDTLLKLCNSDNRLNELSTYNHGMNISLIEALAEERVSKPKINNFPVDSTSSESYIGSTMSFNSCLISESQSSNAKT